LAAAWLESGQNIGALPSGTAPLPGPLLLSPLGQVVVSSGDRLIVADLDGNLLADLGPARLPRWSPKGMVLLFARDQQAWVWDAEENRSFAVSSPEDAEDVPIGWQGSQLYFARVTASGLEVWGADWDGANAFRLWAGEGVSLAAEAPAVIPNGFLLPTTSGWLRLDLDGTVTDLGAGMLPESTVVTSPGGTLISFVASNQLVVAEVNAPGTPLMTLNLTTGPAAGWAFAPSGEELVVVDGQRVAIVSIDGTIRTGGSIPEGWSVAGPLWTADGLYLVVDDGSGQPRILLLAPDLLS
jgi:hypothetical protein